MNQLLDPERLIQVAGLFGVVALVFAESGLFFGFFLPGDSLLFTAGLFASQGFLGIGSLIFWCAIAAIVGDSVGYAFGKRVGPAIFSRQDSIFFHKNHVARAKAFYDKHGKKAIVIARFVPIVRTFAPIVAGVGGMAYGAFLSYNIIGGIAWTLLLTLSGYFLGSAFPQTEHYLNYIIIAIVILSILPIVYEWLRSRRRNVV